MNRYGGVEVQLPFDLGTRWTYEFQIDSILNALLVKCKFQVLLYSGYIFYFLPLVYYDAASDIQ
jgi:hypothetical protein